MVNSLAYALADKVNALWSSEAVQQRTMGMEPMEFRQFVAEQLRDVLKGYQSRGRAPRGRETCQALIVNDEPPVSDFETVPSTITDIAARQVLENAPRKCGQSMGSADKTGYRLGRP